MLPTPFSFIWVLQMLMGYSIFLILFYLSVLVFQLGIFANVKTLLTNHGYILGLIAALFINVAQNLLSSLRSY